MSGGSDRVRLFVALDLPAEVRAELAGWAERELHAVTGLRVVAPESLHVTLCFLGARDPGEVGEIAAVVRGATVAPAAVGLQVGEPVWLPRRRPRVVAVDLADPSGGVAAALQARVAAALVAGGFYEPESRPFLAHVTVARVGGGARVRPVELPAPESLRFAAVGVTLYRSRLGAGGARYEALETVALPGR